MQPNVGSDWSSGPPVGEQSVVIDHASDVVSEALVLDGDEGIREPGTDWVVIVRPGESKNRRTYTESAIAEAVANGFWNGSRMFADHGDMKMPANRSINDLMSRITDTRLAGASEKDSKGRSLAGAALGKVKYIKPGAQELVHAAGEAIGTSIVHRFQGQRYKGTDGQTHERVDHFLQNYSVDWVAYPAAGGGLLGSENEGEDDVDWSQLTAEMVEAHAPAVVEAILAKANEGTEEGMTGNGASGEGTGAAGLGTPAQITPEQMREIASAAAAEAVTQALDARDKKAADINAVRDQIAARVAESDLPEQAKLHVAAGFAGTETYDEAVVDAAIESMKSVVKAIGARGPRPAGLGGSEATNAGGSGMSYEEAHPALQAFESVGGMKIHAVSEGN